MSVAAHRWSSAVLAATLCVLAAANYLVWLGWDQRNEAWQVAGVAMGLVALAALAGRAQRPHVAIAVVPAVTTLCFAVDAANDSALWAIGAALVVVGSLIGVTLVASFTSIRKKPTRW